MIDSALLADLSTATELASGLPGAWIAESWRVEYGDGRTGFLMLGGQPVGYLFYASDGLMSVCLSRRDTQTVTAATTKLSDAEKADRYDAFFAYAGRYRVEDGMVIHHLDVALNPKMVSTEQRRHARITGDRLLLMAYDAASTRTDFIAWRRASTTGASANHGTEG